MRYTGGKVCQFKKGEEDGAQAGGDRSMYEDLRSIAIDLLDTQPNQDLPVYAAIRKCLVAMPIGIEKYCPACEGTLCGVCGACHRLDQDILFCTPCPLEVGAGRQDCFVWSWAHIFLWKAEKARKVLTTANYLRLKRYVLKLGKDGGLVLFHAGCSLAFTAEEVKRILTWLGDTQREAELSLGHAQWCEDTLGYRVQRGSTLFLLFSEDVGLIYHWLKSRKG
jgi:hypothetical protein